MELGVGSDGDSTRAAATERFVASEALLKGRVDGGIERFPKRSRRIPVTAKRLEYRAAIHVGSIQVVAKGGAPAPVVGLAPVPCSRDIVTAERPHAAVVGGEAGPEASRATRMSRTEFEVGVD